MARNNRNKYKPNNTKPERRSNERRNSIGNNDINWWIQDRISAEQASVLPFVYPTGVSTYKKTGLPAAAAMCLDTLLLPGINKDASSPFNQQMRMLNTNIVQKLGGSGEQSASNTGMYSIALGNIYAFIAFCKRLYGSLKIFTEENIFLPDGLFLLQGFDPAEVREHSRQLLVAINYWISRMNSSYTLPSDMGFVKRWEQLVGNYYSDFQSLKGQIYMYRVPGFFKYNEAQSKCVLTQIPGTADPDTGLLMHTVNDLITFGDGLIDQLMQSDGMNTIASRVKRAWRSDRYFAEQIGEDYTAPIVYSPEILYEIHNTSIAWSPDFVSNILNDGVANIEEVILSVGESYIKNTLVSTLTGDNYLIPADAQYVDVPLPVDKITPELVMLGTRGLICEELNADNKLEVTSCGTELVYQMLYAGWSENNTPTREVMQVSRWRKISTSGNSGYSALARAMTKLSKFDWAPPIVWQSSSDATLKFTLCDTTYVGLVPDENIKMLHRTALASAFNAKDVTPGE